MLSEHQQKTLLRCLCPHKQLNNSVVCADTNNGSSVSENATYDWEQLQDSLVFEQAGFAVVSLKNSSDLPVLFDNLELTLYGTTFPLFVSPQTTPAALA